MSTNGRRKSPDVTGCRHPEKNQEMNALGDQPCYR
jgi:hypothetical protein